MTQKRVQPNTAIDMRGASKEQWDEVERVLQADEYEPHVMSDMPEIYQFFVVYETHYTNCTSLVANNCTHHINHTDLCT